MNTATQLSYAVRVTLQEQVDKDVSYVEYDTLIKKILKWLKPIKYCFAWEIGKKNNGYHLQGYVLLSKIVKKQAISNWFIRHFYKKMYSFSSCRECEFNNIVYVVKDNNICKNKLEIDVKKIDIGNLLRYHPFDDDYIKLAIRTSRINHNNWKLAQKVNKMKTKYNMYLYLCRKDKKCLSKRDVHRIIFKYCMENNKMLPAKFQFKNYIETIYYQLNYKIDEALAIKQSYDSVMKNRDDD